MIGADYDGLLGKTCTLLLLFALLLPGTTWSKTVTVEPGVSLALAEQRAKTLSNIHYRLSLDIPADQQAAIAGHILIEFELTENTQALQLDFQPGADHIHAVSGDAGAIDYRAENEHLVIPGSALRVGPNRLEISFTAGDSSLNRNPQYLYTLFVPDRARTAFPLFEQPDLKARYQLKLAVPADWEAIGNAPLERKHTEGNRTRYQFALSEPTSSYLFSFVAGRFERISREINGRAFTLLHRETDENKVQRNLDAIFELHSSALHWLENYTGIEYPYAKFDFALIPSFQYGGMEHPGAIQYRASALLLDESPTQSQLLDRAGLIAHETAHMWFGNLVTMKWFNDVWTKEVFANFMAAKIVNPAFPHINHDLNFLMRHYPGAYSVDRSAGANPIRQALANLDQAGQMYGPIIYKKAPIMMRQLELVLGADAFRKGMQRYLNRFAFGNATWPELIAILDPLTSQDLTAWSEVWVNTSGRPHFELTMDPPLPLLRQRDPAGRSRSWPQQFSAAFPGGPITINSTAKPVNLVAAPEQLNADGYGYGLFPLVAAGLTDQQNPSALARGALLIDAWENFLEGTLTSAMEYARFLLARSAREDNPLILEQALNQLSRVYNSFLSGEEQTEIQAQLETALHRGLTQGATPGYARLYFETLSELATSPASLDYLLQLLSGTLSLESLPLSETDRIKLAERLALKRPGQAASILASQRKRIENPDNLRRFDFVMPAVSPDEAVRDQFFNSLADQRNRATERWVLDALGYLHHPSRVQQSQRYILPSLELLEEIQVTGDIFFPSGWVESTLKNHRSAAAVQIVDQFLDERPAYNPQLRMKLLQAADMPRRASNFKQSIDR